MVFHHSLFTSRILPVGFWGPPPNGPPKFMCFSLYLGIGCQGGGGVLPRDWYTHNLLMQFFTLGSLKIEVSKTYFFDIVTTQCDHPRYVKHVRGRIYVFCTLFGYWVPGGGGGQTGLVHNLLMQLFQPTQLEKLKFSKLTFLIL